MYRRLCERQKQIQQNNALNRLIQVDHQRDPYYLAATCTAPIQSIHVKQMTSVSIDCGTNGPPSLVRLRFRAGGGVRFAVAAPAAAGRG